MAIYNDGFMTIYQKDYEPKSYSRVLPCSFKSDIKQLVEADFGNKSSTEVESIEEFRKRLLCKYPVLRRYLQGEVHEVKLLDGKTVYQVDYCKPGDKFESKKTQGRRREALPDDWADIPATVQKASYRDFKNLVNWKVVPQKWKPPPSMFQPNYKEREILKVRTGESEYIGGKIGTLGKTIIKDCLHGKLFDFSKMCAMADEIDSRRIEERHIVRAPYQQQFR